MSAVQHFRWDDGWLAPGCAGCPELFAGDVLSHRDNCPELAALAADALEIAARERRAEQDSMHADLSLLLRTLGMGDHARPQSPHEVMLEAVAEVKRTRDTVALKEAQVRHLSELAAGFGQNAQRQAAKLAILRAAVQRVLSDEESRPGCWGPDVTALGWLREALEATE